MRAWSNFEDATTLPYLIMTETMMKFINEIEMFCKKLPFKASWQAKSLSLEMFLNQFTYKRRTIIYALIRWLMKKWERLNLLTRKLISRFSPPEKCETKHEKSCNWMVVLFKSYPRCPCLRRTNRFRRSNLCQLRKVHQPRDTRDVLEEWQLAKYLWETHHRWCS